MKKCLLFAGLFCSVLFVSFAHAQVAPTCSDGILNQWETSVDCGGSYCVETCDLGQTCRIASDCASDYCNPSGICAVPTCSDGIQNQGETTIDCGGPVCGNTCAIGQTCSAADGSDCASGYCAPTGTCAVAATCFDGYMNQDETYPDSGGTTCAARSGNTEGCLVNSDCSTNYCAGGVCTTENAPFLATFRTTTANESITLPLTERDGTNGAFLTYNFTVDWNDPNDPGTDVITAYNQAEITHTYAVPGDHQISITGSMPIWNFYTVKSSKDQIISIDDAGDVGFGTGITNFYAMFAYTTKLTTIARFDTSSGTSFSYMFSGSGLTEIPFIDTSSGTNFGNMFSGVTNVTTIPLLDTSSGTNFAGMFTGMTSITEIPLIDTSKGTSLGSMFAKAGNLTTIPLLDTSSVTNFSRMFWDCVNLTSVPLLDTHAGLNFGEMFRGADSLTTIPLLDTSAGTSFYAMFSYSDAITTIPLLDTSNGSNFTYMFSGNINLESVPLIDTGKAPSFLNMFKDTPKLTEIPLLDTGMGTNFSAMFAGSGVTTIPLLDTSKGEVFTSMFNGARSLTELPLIDTGNGLNFYGMFAFTDSLSSIPALNTSKGTDFGYMFRDTGLTTIPLLDTSMGTSFNSIFLGVDKLTQAALDGTRYTISYANNKMDSVSLIDVFEKIGTADNSVEPQILDISENPGIPGLTEADYVDVLAKGWTVVADYTPTCTDGYQNGDETGVDCGGSCGTACEASCANLTTSYFEKFFYHDNPQIQAITTALTDYQYYDCDNKIFRKGNASQQMEDISMMLALRLTTADLNTMNTNKTATHKQSYYDTEAKVFRRGLADGSLESVSADERMLTTAEIAAMSTAAEGEFYYNMTTLQFYIGESNGSLSQLFATQ